MNNIIQKAIEGGWILFPSDYPHDYGLGITQRVVVCDPSFWQALGKACGWENETCWNHETEKVNGLIAVCNCDGGKQKKNWFYYALRFHEINLTEGWDKAVEYLQSLIESK